MVVKFLKRGYCNIMLAYYVDYIDDVNGKTERLF